MNYMILMVSPSGGGKSTLAKELLEEYTSSSLNLTGIICSTDDFFVQDGVYNFDIKKLGVNHKKNQDKVAYYADKNYPDEQKNVIIIDNTNLSVEECSHYVKIGLENDYTVRLITPDRALKMTSEDFDKANVHNVPKETIEKQTEKFKNWQTFGPKLAEKFGAVWNAQTKSLTRV